MRIQRHNGMKNPVDLIGRRFGKLQVIGFAENDHNYHRQWECICDCNPDKSVIIPSARLAGTAGTSVSCKECGRYGQAKIKREQLIGKKVGQLLVLEEMPFHSRDGGRRMKCRCDCGCELVVLVNNLLGGRSMACTSCPKKLTKGQAAFNKLYRSYRSKAEKRGLEFSLSEELFHLLTQGCCHYCGRSPCQSVNGTSKVKCYGDYIYNGLDRLDSSLGYTAANVVSCCGMCNELKNSLSSDEFFSTIKLIYKHRISDGDRSDFNRLVEEPFDVLRPAFRLLYSKYQHNAKDRGVAFALSTQDFYVLTKRPCFYCGRLPFRKQKYGGAKPGYKFDEYIYNGIDRVSPEAGYVSGNVRSACGVCNRMKVDYAEGEFLGKIQAICYQHNLATLD